MRFRSQAAGIIHISTHLFVGRVLEILVVLVIVLNLLRRKCVLRIDVIEVTIVVVLVLQKVESIGNSVTFALSQYL